MVERWASHGPVTCRWEVTPPAPRAPPGVGVAGRRGFRCPVSPQLQSQGQDRCLIANGRFLGRGQVGGAWGRHRPPDWTPRDGPFRSPRVPGATVTPGKGDTSISGAMLPQAQGGGLPASPRSHPAPEPPHLEPERLAAGTQSGPARRLAMPCVRRARGPPSSVGEGLRVRPTPSGGKARAPPPSRASI